jgi:hypothetical protein
LTPKKSNNCIMTTIIQKNKVALKSSWSSIILNQQIIIWHLDFHEIQTWKNHTILFAQFFGCSQIEFSRFRKSRLQMPIKDQTIHSLCMYHSQYP